MERKEKEITLNFLRKLLEEFENTRYRNMESSQEVMLKSVIKMVESRAE